MFVLPELKNPYSAYAPYIDAKTMELHHDKHHRGYVKKLNKAMVENDIDTDRIEDLFEKIADYPDAIRQNGGGHYNHTVFWSLLDDTMSTPTESLLQKLTDTFGGLEDFKAEFTKAALGVFGSGWVWLIVASDGDLKITTTRNQDNPLMSNQETQGYPLIAVDVWEHAYYLNYQNERVKYLNALWSLIDWNVVCDRYRNRMEMNELN
tara:strand:+ start:2484 stop:3104 length:621 start_codon:yes stop_codon:yes gene_type:complete